MTFNEFASKKVVGIPVLYLAGGAVIILAVVAYRMKSTPDSTVTPDANAAGDATVDQNGLADGTNPYGGLATSGTVTVVQQPTDTTATTPTINTNSEWVRAGAEWLTAEKGVSGSVAASALNKYVNGIDRTYEEQSYVDMVIEEKGQPPDDIAEGGNVGSAPAQKQFTEFPGRHVVKNTSDNGYPQLAQLYYNSAAGDRIDLLQAANPTLGDGPWPTGTTINIPAYHAPIYYTVTNARGETASQVAAKNGISLIQMAVLNNVRGGVYQPAYLLIRNSRVRVK